jgi:hypothetical protein
LTSCDVAIDAAKAYASHVQNLSANAPALVSKDKISPQVQASIDFVTAVLAINSNKSMQTALGMCGNHKAATRFPLPSTIQFYLGTSHVRADDIARVVLKYGGSWNREWLGKVLTMYPDIGQAVQSLQPQQATQQPSYPPQVPPSRPSYPSPQGRSRSWEGRFLLSVAHA